MNHLSRVAVVFVALAAMAASAPAGAARKAKDLLQYIPADAPYVFAYTKAFPDDLQDRFEPAMDNTLSAYQRILRITVEDEIEKLSAEEGGQDEAKRLEALVDEVVGLLSVQGLRDAGLGRDALLAVYGDGILPVLRIALSDRDDFEATIARLESKVEDGFEVGSVDGQSYRYKDMDELRLIVATPGKDAVIAIVPPGSSDQRLARTLGLKKPRDNMYRSKALRMIAREYGFTDHIGAFIDVERVVAGFTGDPGGLNAGFFQIADHDPSALSPECRAEFAEMAAIAPRVVMGYTRVTDDYLDTKLVVELRDDIAAGLATLPAAVPGLGADPGGLVSFGFSLDPMALRNFYEARLDAMEADPYECAKLAELQAGTAKGREALAKPLPPVVYSFRGFLANVTDIRGMDVAAEKPPESIDAGILFAVENAEALVTMAALMSPEIAAANLLPDGKARELNLPQLAEIAEKAFAALSESALAVSLGADAEQEAVALLEAGISDDRPLISMAMDTNRYYELIGDAVMNAAPEEGDEPLPHNMRTALRDAMVSSGAIYERMSMNVHLTEKGIEVGSRLALAD